MFAIFTRVSRGLIKRKIKSTYLQHPKKIKKESINFNSIFNENINKYTDREISKEIEKINKFMKNCLISRNKKYYIIFIFKSTV